MDTSHLADVARRERLCVSITCDPTAEIGERWVASVGLDCYGAGQSADEALAEALTRAILGPEPICHDQDDVDEPLPFTDEPTDDEHDDPASLGERPLLAGRR